MADYDYNQIVYIMQQKKFSVFKHSERVINIIKNEHGTFGEFFDYLITVKVDPKTNYVIHWSISDNGTSTDEYISNIETQLKAIFNSNKQILFTDACLSIANIL
jgi:cation transport regulator ChaC